MPEVVAEDRRWWGPVISQSSPLLKSNVQLVIHWLWFVQARRPGASLAIALCLLALWTQRNGSRGSNQRGRVDGMLDDWSHPRRWLSKRTNGLSGISPSRGYLGELGDHEWLPDVSF